ncbi:MAG: SseB family protein [Candidatus Limnocylindria bacterium]
MTQAVPERPAPGSHDPKTPTGSLEESAATLWDAAIAARDAEARGDDDHRALHAFYRALMSGTLILPVPPEHGEDAKSALASAVNDEEEVEISVMLARDPDGNPISVAFGSFAALAAWAPSQTGNLPLPARIAVANLAASSLPAILDPAGPVPYRFEADELAALAAGRLPGTDEPIFAATERRSIRVRLPGSDTSPLEDRLATALQGSGVDAAYLVESDAADGRARLMLGLVGEPGASATVDVPDGTDVVWLEEPLLSAVRAVTDPFHRRDRR